MKASIKFREDQTPIFRTKIPLNIVGIPFLSSLSAGNTSELSLALSTFFDSGPSLRLSYKPNDSFNPFSLSIRTGIGPLGAPTRSSPLIMSAEFNLLNRGKNPCFMLRFKPSFGDFEIKKKQKSDALFEKTTKSIQVEDEDCEVGRKRMTVLPPEVREGGGVVSELIGGAEVAARSSLPVRGGAVVKFRWGVKVPADIKGVDPTVGISFRRFPFLVMNKIKIEHVERSDTRREGTKDEEFKGRMVQEVKFEEFFGIKRQLDVLKAENGMLKKAIEDLRYDFAGAGAAGRYGHAGRGLGSESEKNGVRNGKVERRYNNGDNKKYSNGSKSMETDVNEELKKALMGLEK